MAAKKKAPIAASTTAVAVKKKTPSKKSGYYKSTTTKIWDPDYSIKKRELETQNITKKSGSLVAPGFEFEYKLKVNKKNGASEAWKRVGAKMLVDGLG
ncbi:hypothetical protein HDU86_008483 [Geranomyces michiganensis]|nr:hypothetical protein HDU86_008483 [Geranomyces michiganensis]